MPGLRRLIASQSFALLVLGASALAIRAAAQDDDESPYRPGLIATYTAGGNTVIRTDEVLALDWQDAACDPSLPAGEFSAQWGGRLWARGAGSYRLLCYVQGDVAIKLAGKTVIQ